jgi:hypothetical protein
MNGRFIDLWPGPGEPPTRCLSRPATRQPGSETSEA